MKATAQMGGLTRQEIQDIARDVLQKHGAMLVHSLALAGKYQDGGGYTGSNLMALMELFYEALVTKYPSQSLESVRSEALEEAAKVCEQVGRTPGNGVYMKSAHACAAAIRALGK